MSPLSHCTICARDPSYELLCSPRLCGCPHDLQCRPRNSTETHHISPEAPHSRCLITRDISRDGLYHRSCRHGSKSRWYHTSSDGSRSHWYHSDGIPCISLVPEDTPHRDRSHNDIRCRKCRPIILSRRAKEWKEWEKMVVSGMCQAGSLP